MHYAIFFNDYSLGKEYGFDFSFLRPEADYQTKYQALRAYIKRQNPQRVEAIGGGFKALHSITECCYYRMQHIESRANIVSLWYQAKATAYAIKKNFRSHIQSSTMKMLKYLQTALFIAIFRMKIQMSI